MHRCISAERHELPNDAPVVPIDWNLGGRLYRVTVSNAVCRRPCVLKKIFRVDPERRQQHGCNEKRLRCVSVLIIFHATYAVARNSVGTFDMTEREEPPNDVPRGANCLKSVLGHACIHCLDTIYHKVIGRNRSTCLGFLDSAQARTRRFLIHFCVTTINIRFPGLSRDSGGFASSLSLNPSPGNPT